MVRIEKGFKTAFALALVVYVAITATFSLIAAFIAGNFQIGSLGSYLFGAIMETPPEGVITIVNTSMNLISPTAIGALVGTIGSLVACLAGAVIAGYLCGGGKQQAFTSWYLIAIISSVVIYVINIIIINASVISEVVSTLVKGLLNGIFYAAIAMLVNPEYY
jgi:hypothetical protein